MKSKKDWINLLIYIVLMVVISLIPPSGPITALGMKVIAIMVATIYAWCSMDIIWPSFVALVLVGLSGFSSVNALYASAMSNNTLMQMFFLLLFGGVIASSGMGDALALRIINLKMAKGKPWLLTILIILAAFIPGLIIGGIPATLIVWSIIYSICEEVGLEKKSPWVVLVIFMTAFMGNNAMNVFPFQISVVAVTGFARAVDPTVSVPYGPWMIFVLIFTLATMAVCLLVYKLIFKPDLSKLKNYESKENIPPFTFEQKSALWLMLALVILLLIPNMLPKGNFVVDNMNRIGAVGIIALVVAASQFIVKDGKQCFPFKKVADNGIMWPMMIMSTTALTISSAMTSAESGVSAALTQFVSAATGGSGGVIFGFMILAIALLATNILANNVVGLITITILFTLAPSVGINPMIYFALLLFAGNCGYLFPSSSTPAAMLYGNLEWIGKGDIIKYSAVLIVIVLVMFAVLGIPLASVMFA
jgi:sodium-dependent dicarboxylate transporter 2/3/5